MPTLPWILIKFQLAFAMSVSVAIPGPELQTLRSPDPSNSLPGLGDSCKGICSLSTHAVCHNGTCECHSSYPVPVKKACYKSALLGEDCQEDEQCKYYDQNAICERFSRDYKGCSCTDEYTIKEIVGLNPPKACFPGKRLRDADLKSFFALGLGLSMFSGLICLALHLFARARFARHRGYANAAIPPPLTVSETYAAFAMGGSRTPSFGGHSVSSSRRTSYNSLHKQKAGHLIRLSSASSLSHHRPGSRRPSLSSIRSYRSQTGLVLPDARLDRDHYILYMIRAPTQSVTSDTTTTTCDSISPRTPKSTEQLLAVYHAVPEHSLRDLAVVGPSHTTSTFRTLSSEDVFQEEEEEEMETEEEVHPDEDDDAKQSSSQDEATKSLLPTTKRRQKDESKSRRPKDDSKGRPSTNEDGKRRRPSASDPTSNRSLEDSTRNKKKSEERNNKI